MDLDNEARWGDGSTWEKVDQGKIPMTKAYEAYRENLRYVLDEIQIVLNNVNANVVITADHGNAFGELGETAHGQPYLDVVRKVPWVEVVANDSDSYTPELESIPGRNHKHTTDTEEKLRALGYKR
jgi:membrane-anchored protein YejM (alkaline phosphatase superfamily)